jgi:hypothetical protein
MVLQKWADAIILAALRRTETTDPLVLAKIASYKRKRSIAIKLSRGRSAPQRAPSRKRVLTIETVAPPSEDPVRFYPMTTANVSLLNKAVAAGRRRARELAEALMFRLSAKVNEYIAKIDRFDRMSEREQLATAESIARDHRMLFSAYFAYTRSYTLSRRVEARIKTGMSAMARTAPIFMTSDDNLQCTDLIPADDLATISIADPPDEFHFQTTRAVEQMCMHRFEHIHELDSNADGEEQKRRAQCNQIIVHLEHMAGKLGDILSEIKADNGQVSYIHRVIVRIEDH